MGSDTRGTVSSTTSSLTHAKTTLYWTANKKPLSDEWMGFGYTVAHHLPQWMLLSHLIHHPYVKSVNVLCIMYVDILQMYYVKVIYLNTCFKRLRDSGLWSLPCEWSSGEVKSFHTSDRPFASRVWHTGLLTLAHAFWCTLQRKWPWYGPCFGSHP